ncbi:MAG: terpene cyclase/mutase family protein [Phycisphaerae bacterium]|nr:terpene cyclase/mutase family protein [Phycisphaerae bacterium]
MLRDSYVAMLLIGAILFAGVLTAAAQTTSQPSSRDAVAAERDRAMQAEARKLIERGAQYLLSAQEADGGWGAQAGPGVSALVLKALIQEPSVGPQHAAVQRGIEFVLKSQRDDGGVYSAEGLLKNYESSVVLSMLGVLKDPAYQKQIAALQTFLKNDQWDEGEGKSVDDPWYGGAGYGHGKRPDVSNTQMMLEALRDSGLPPDDPAYKKALVFIGRCQMLGETNDQPFAKGATQGGFIYSPANGGESKMGTVDAEGHEELRCYGSMTYAGFKSLLYAGLKRDDRRVQAALDWIRGNWTLTHNPNSPEAQSREGLFYYYHVFGRALDAFGEAVIREPSGREHIWRHELVEQLAKDQKPDGSWVNDADRWMEGLPALTTAYSMLALEAAYPR